MAGFTPSPCRPRSLMRSVRAGPFKNSVSLVCQGIYCQPRSLFKESGKKFGAPFERAKIAPKPYEPTPPQPRKNIDIAELILAVIFKIFGFHSAAKQILYGKQALERSELQQQKFHTAQAKWAAQNVLKERARPAAQGTGGAAGKRTCGSESNVEARISKIL